MKTYRIKKEDLKNKKVLAEGYKIFKQGFKARDYSYADENGNVVGTFHKVDGEIQECEWGLHFSRNPFNCFNFYECVQWNEFAKVRAYEKIIDSKDEEKTVAQVIEIVEIYSFDEFIEVLKEYNKKQYISNGVNNSHGINGSNGVNNSDGVNNSHGINGSNGVNYSRGVNGSNGVNYSHGVNYSDGVNNSDGVNGSNGVNVSNGVNGSNGVNDSHGVNYSNGVNYSRGINGSHGVNNSNGVNYSRGVNDSDGVNNSDGVNVSNGVNGSYGVIKSEAVSQSIFCYNFTGKYGLFNKIVTPERIEEVKNNIYQFNWNPIFNNAFEMKKEKQEWFKINIPNIFEIDNKTAWATMPKEMKKYIKSLEEYNEKIFEKIIGDLDD